MRQPHGFKKQVNRPGVIGNGAFTGEAIRVKQQAHLPFEPGGMKGLELFESSEFREEEAGLPDPAVLAGPPVVAVASEHDFAPLSRGLPFPVHGSSEERKKRDEELVRALIEGPDKLQKSQDVHNGVNSALLPHLTAFGNQQGVLLEVIPGRPNL